MKKILPLGLAFMAFILPDVHLDAQTPKLSAAFYFSKGIVVDSKGNVFVIGKSNKVIKITPDGKATCFAGSIHGFIKHKDGQGTAASFSGTKGIAIDEGDPANMIGTLKLSNMKKKIENAQNNFR